MPDSEPPLERSPGDRTTRFGDVLAIREFQLLWVAVAQSAIGDQLAKVALSILVFDRTGSPLLTAATYGATYVPYLVAGPLLAPLGDRYRRREVIIVSDLVRAVLMGVMVIPGLPLWTLFVLVFAAGLAKPPFDAARSAMLPDILPGDLFVMGTAVTQTTSQLTQVIGFAVGGIIVGTIGAHEALLLNALTFALSALLFRIGIKNRPATRGRGQGMARVITTGTKVVFGDPRLRALIGMGMLAGFYVVPEGLAVPYVQNQLSLDPFHSGILLASGPLGMALGSLMLSRFVRPIRRTRVMGPLSVVGLLCLIPFWFVPSFRVACVLVFVSGLALGYSIAANQAFVSIVSNRSRGQALGLAQALLSLAQGAAIVLAGAVATAMSSAVTISISGTLGAIVAFLLWLGWAQATRSYEGDRDD
ncbi:MAG: MFS transporter [Streptosporangiales bacterium]